VATAFDRLADLLRALNEESVCYIHFGGQAVNLHGIPRFTDDIDLFVEPTDENVERLRHALRRLWNDPAIEEIQAVDLRGDYAVIRYGTPDGFPIDLAARIGDAFRFEDVQSETLMVGTVPARVATARMLYRMKRDTMRPIDHADAADLKAKFAINDD